MSCSDETRVPTKDSRAPVNTTYVYIIWSIFKSIEKPLIQVELRVFAWWRLAAASRHFLLHTWASFHNSSNSIV